MLDVARWAWDAKYRLRDATRVERDLDDTWQRVSDALASAEAGRARARWRARFHTLLASGEFLPGGRIVAGAGSGRRVTLLNCFVMGPIHDSVEGILDALREGALTMHQGGGVGFDFSTLRPRGTPARSTDGEASGPVSFMEIWDTTCRTLLATSARRGAMMATLRCDHPDIETFVDAKRVAGTLTNFNLSVLVSDAFMEAVASDRDWQLRFPPRGAVAVEGLAPVERTVRARALWDRVLRAAYECAEPGVLFIDRINAENNLGWCESISATNPCGEIPLPPYGACVLGSLDLTRFVRAPFEPEARVDHAALAAAAAIATRALDNVIEISGFPLPAQKAQAQRSRRIGLGITGLADALLMLGMRYGDDSSLLAAGAMMRTVCHAAYGASVNLARERGAFAAFTTAPYLDAPFVRRLPAEIRDGIGEHGIRNSHLTAVAPAGTISLLAGGVSSGIEPVFAARYRREVRDAAGEVRPLEVVDPAVAAFNRLGHDGLPAAFVDAAGVDAEQQLAMQAAVQRHVDNAISKTVILPAGASFEGFRSLYTRAHELGLKGCTVYRPTAVRGAVLEAGGARDDAPHCCALDREPG
jgi:ribonucleoside-diphosphate reductase alpha chain